jgi:hypothetical protein
MEAMTKDVAWSSRPQSERHTRYSLSTARSHVDSGFTAKTSSHRSYAGRTASVSRPMDVVIIEFLSDMRDSHESTRVPPLETSSSRSRHHHFLKRASRHGAPVPLSRIFFS